MAASNRFLDLIRYGMSVWRRRALRRAFFDAQLALGERMYAAGIDDGHLAAQISAWDEKIRQSKAQKGSRKALVAARNQLLLQLATAPGIAVCVIDMPMSIDQPGDRVRTQAIRKLRLWEKICARRATEAVPPHLVT
jgi:hypothetical protein